MTIAHSSTENLNNWFHELQEFQLDSFFDSVILGSAFEYVSKVKLIESHKTKIICQLHGIKKYDVEIKLVGSEILASCTCPYDQKCKHMAAVILSQMDIKY